ncbi:GFA family protein [Ramlibacter rhizophilus]|uniref:GFA family protein n=1 Tax=Ramlibacter rhizophilus TaxID=1781167 RepID=UPI003B82FDA9
MRHRGREFGSRGLWRPQDLCGSGSSGRVTTRSFCAECGTPLFTRSEVNPQYTSIRFPALEGHASGFAPMLDIWTSRAQPWVCLDPDIPHFAESPQ